jgi:hypothetical protein
MAEFVFKGDVDVMTCLDSKQKSAFTRQYNKSGIR